STGRDGAVYGASSSLGIAGFACEKQCAIDWARQLRSGVASADEHVAVRAAGVRVVLPIVNPGSDHEPAGLTTRDAEFPGKRFDGSIRDLLVAERRQLARTRTARPRHEDRRRNRVWRPPDGKVSIACVHEGQTIQILRFCSAHETLTGPERLS